MLVNQFLSEALADENRIVVGGRAVIIILTIGQVRELVVDPLAVFGRDVSTASPSFCTNDSDGRV